METLLDEYVNVYGGYPEVIQFDLGTEFHNTQVIPLLDSLGIRHFSTRPTSKKAALVERWNKEIKKLMFRYFHKAGDERWIDVLQDLVRNVNSKTNSSIGMPPDEVTEENSFEVFARLYGKATPFEKPKLSVGDRVRISNYSSPLFKPNKRTFRKGYLESFSEQIFLITKVSHGSPPMYFLKFGEGEKEGDEVKGRMYGAELVRAEPPQE